MSNLETKIANFSKAVIRLQDAIDEYEKTYSDTVRDGAIQRFELCMELAWKTTREYLIEQGFAELNSPKAVMREAYASHIIDSQELWISALNDRNLTSHVYDEKTSNEVFSRICGSYVPLLKKLDELFRA
jgi:nucleotidyltransferase substrate binding protein (TIGR01987 family)